MSYRIEYNKGDEFDAVCNDFNEMAARLSDMVKQRQVDDNSRKELIAGIIVSDKFVQNLFPDNKNPVMSNFFIKGKYGIYTGVWL